MSRVVVGVEVGVVVGVVVGTESELTKSLENLRLQAKKIDSYKCEPSQLAQKISEYESSISLTKRALEEESCPRIARDDFVTKVFPALKAIYQSDAVFEGQNGRNLQAEDSNSFTLLELILKKTEGLSEEEKTGFKGRLGERFDDSVVRPGASRVTTGGARRGVAPDPSSRVELSSASSASSAFSVPKSGICVIQ